MTALASFGEALEDLSGSEKLEAVRFSGPSDFKSRPRDSLGKFCGKALKVLRSA